MDEAGAGVKGSTIQERSEITSVPSHRRLVYVCHPYSADVTGNTMAVRAICHELADEGVLPIAPQVYLPQFVDEQTERDETIAMCVQLVGLCDEIRVYGEQISAGMFREIDHAARVGVPVRWMVEEAA